VNSYHTYTHANRISAKVDFYTQTEAKVFDLLPSSRQGPKTLISFMIWGILSE